MGHKTIFILFDNAFLWTW